MTASIGCAANASLSARGSRTSPTITGIRLPVIASTRRTASSRLLDRLSNDDDLLALLEQLDAGVGADVAGSAGDQNCQVELAPVCGRARWIDGPPPRSKPGRGARQGADLRDQEQDSCRGRSQTRATGEPESAETESGNTWRGALEPRCVSPSNSRESSTGFGAVPALAGRFARNVEHGEKQEPGAAANENARNSQKSIHR